MPVGPCVIPSALEREHFMLTGSTGTGKSTLLRGLLYEIQRRKQAVVVVDPDSEFVQEFYNEARGDIILNPLDARCPFWNPWLEFRAGREDTDIEAFAASLFRGNPKPGDKEDFFLKSSRTIMAAILTKTRTTEDLLHFINQPPNVLHKLLHGTPAFAAITPGAAAQGAGILMQVSNAIRTFKYLPHQNYARRMWSAHEWAANPRGWLFLSSKHDNRAAALPIQGLWLDSITRCLLAQDIGAPQSWIIADELPLLGHQSKIQEALVSGRKRGISIVIGFQNIAQLDEIYGRDATKTLTSQPRTRVFFGGGNDETNKWISDQIGRAEIRRTYQTHTKSWGKSSTSEAEHRLSTHLVTADEVEQLRRQPGHAYLAVGGYDRVRIVIPKRNLQAKHPDFVPRQRQEPKGGDASDAYSAGRSEHGAAVASPASNGGDAGGRAKPISCCSIWSNMESRCRPRSELKEFGGIYKKHKQWAHYGGRQRCISCDQLYPGDGRACPKCGTNQSKDDPVLLLFENWEDMEAELKEPRKAQNWTVDRIRSDGNYEAGNIRWLEREKQNANRQNYKRAATI